MANIKCSWIDDAELYAILNQFNENELRVISRYNKMLEDAFKKKNDN